MDTHTLTTIIITAVVATVAKEVASWFVRRTANVATTVKNTVVKHWRMIDLILEGVVALAHFGFAFWLSQAAASMSGGTVFGVSFLIGLGFWYLREFEIKFLAYGRSASQVQD